MVGQAIRLRCKGRSPGFTLVELAVVVAIIGVLATLLLPALSRSKMRAQSLTCVNNAKHLTLSWSLYTSENQNRLAYNLGGDPGRGTFAPKNTPNWVNNIMDWELSPDNTNMNFVYTSLLTSEGNYPAGLFRCPADRALSEIQRRAGWEGRVRSISMNAMVGNPGSLLNTYGNNVNNPRYQQYLRDSDIQDPSSIFVFVDEHPDSINDGYFLNTRNSRWTDLPASSHNGGGSFSFADGSVRIHRWRDERTIRPSRPDAARLPIMLTNVSVDFEWILQHTSVEK